MTLLHNVASRAAAFTITIHSLGIGAFVAGCAFEAAHADGHHFPSGAEVDSRKNRITHLAALKWLAAVVASRWIRSIGVVTAR